jgi:thiamine pyrophosphokinase
VNEHIVIVTGASALDPAVAARLPAGARVIAVDGGLDHALAAGLTPTELVGDLDSVSETGLAWAARHATITRHPVDKDQTDTELALTLASTSDPARITLVGGGDRLDHTLAAIGALGAPALTSVPVLDGWWGSQHVRVLHGPPRRSRCSPSTVGAPTWRCAARVGSSSTTISIPSSVSASATR